MYECLVLGRVKGHGGWGCSICCHSCLWASRMYACSSHSTIAPPLSAGLMTVCGSWRNSVRACLVSVSRLAVVGEVREGRCEQMLSQRRFEKIWRFRFWGGGGSQELGLRKGGGCEKVECRKW